MCSNVPHNATAFEMLVERYQAQIFAHVLRVMDRNRDDAADLTQETFVRAYLAGDRVHQMSNVAAWLHRVAANLCIDELRRRARFRTVPWSAIQYVPSLYADPLADPQLLMIHQEADAAMRGVLSHCSPRNQRVLMLRADANFSHREIGHVLGISDAAAKSVTFRARREFRTYARRSGLTITRDRASI